MTSSVACLSIILKMVKRVGDGHRLVLHCWWWEKARRILYSANLDHADLCITGLPRWRALLDSHDVSWSAVGLSGHSVERVGQIAKRSIQSFVCFRHLYWSCRRTNTISVVLLFVLKPHCLSGRWSSAMAGNCVFRGTEARIFLTIKSRVIPRWSRKSDFSPNCL